jgi:hypothetical protein
MSYPVPSILFDSDITFDLDSMDSAPNLAEKNLWFLSKYRCHCIHHISVFAKQNLCSAAIREKTTVNNSINSHAQDTTALQFIVAVVTYFSTAVHKRV